MHSTTGVTFLSIDSVMEYQMGVYSGLFAQIPSPDIETKNLCAA